MPHDPLQAAADLLRDARSVCVITGAGVSAESKIPTFRDAMEGLWAKFDPQTLATPEAFAADPAMVSEWYDFRRGKCAQAEPNPGHLALVEIERRLADAGRSFTLLTQNVDGLHRRAGSTRVVELHGRIDIWRCTKTGLEYPDLPLPLPEYPMPSEAGGLLRPGVVWFGEALPEDALEQAHAAAESCDLFMSVGTSAVVYPAAGFLHLARAHGSKSIEINRDPTDATGLVDIALQGRSGEILPALVELAFASRG